jgi:septum formation protein
MLILASGSPRRATLLRAAGIAFEVESADVDESPLPNETPLMHVRRLSEAKARAVATRRPGDTVLGADTVVTIDKRILGKPRDADDAAEMLRALSGRAHDVLTGVSIIGSEGVTVDVACTRVSFLPLTETEISWYVATREPMDKAGAYAIQGLGSRFIERIEGSYTNVVGLPVALVYRLLRAVS